jgi:AcrR family transcriptional regulator
MPSTTQEAPDQTAVVASGAAGRRLTVVDAFVDLVLERGSAPTPEEVAERGGVSRATLFRYFSTLNELRREALARVAERYADLLTIPHIDGEQLDDRMRRFVDSRVELHETLHALELVSRAEAVHDAEAAAHVDAVRHVLAEQARRHFAADLDRFGPARQDDIVTAISVLTSVESWQQFRHSHGRTPLQTRRAWRDALTAILTAPVDETSGRS